MARKFIEDKVLYRQKEAALHNLVKSLTPMILEVGKHNVNEIPNHLKIIFIEKEFMPLFAPMADDDIRSCKIVNFEKPAVELSFFTKHKYYLKKKVNLAYIRDYLGMQLNELIEKKDEIILLIPLEMEKENRELLKEQLDSYIRQIEELKNIIDNLEQYDFAISNYEMGYLYTELSYKYQTANGNYDNENSHIIKSNELEERINVIFIDEQAIQKPIANQQKKVDAYLATFPIQFTEPSKVIYLKRK
jgi:hypothetical protein